ncbi:MAG: DUF58 domain-containing protein [Planctomycetes bacterium]|nr:DUF58 domain-containing protein [Planctomycetota bacterium]
MAAEKSKLRVAPTEHGRAIITATCFVFLASLVIPAFGVFAGLICFHAAALWVGYLLRPSVSITGDLPDHIVAGEETQLRFQVTSASRRKLCELTVTLDHLPETVEQTGPPFRVDQLKPGESITVTLSILARQRGHYTMGYPICSSSFPFNLYSFGLAHPEREELLVFPAFDRLTLAGIASEGIGQSSVGLGTASLRGASPEYIGNRPYVTGDSLRDIDARAWARLASPVVKEYHHEFHRHGALILDVAETSKTTTGTQLFEAAVSLCASIAFSLQSECLIDFLVTGAEVHDLATVPAGARVRRIHEILAHVKPDPTPLSVNSQLEHLLHGVSDLYIIQSAHRPGPHALAEWMDCRRQNVKIIEVGHATSTRRRSSPPGAEDLCRVSAEDVLNKEVKHL